MSLGMKTQGVMTPASQLATGDEGPPMTVQFAGAMQPIQVRWYDEAGVGHDVVWFLGPGGVVYEPPNAEAWASELRPIKDELLGQVLSHLGLDKKTEASDGGDIPSDGVDIMDAGGESNEEASAGEAPASP